MLRGPDARLRLITALLIAALLPIGAQLIRLQILEHKNYAKDVEAMVRRQYTMPDPAPGLILDRNGDLLVGNTPVYYIGAEINLITDTLVAATGLSPLLGIEVDKLAEMIEKPWNLDVYKIVLNNGLSGEVVQRLSELQNTVWPWLTIDQKGLLPGSGTSVYEIGAKVNFVTEPRESAAILAPLLEIDESYLTYLLTMPSEKDIIWRPLAGGIGGDEADAIAELRRSVWPWLTMQPAWRRFYAEGALASHLLGFVNDDGEGYGVEAFQQRFLRPKSVADMGMMSADQTLLPEDMQYADLMAYPGTDIRLTIDRTIQAFVEGELDKALVEYSAQGGTILVLNPKTGEILAVASRPHYEPANYAQYWANGNSKYFTDPAISKAYEPGSVFKVLTVAAALDSGAVTLDWSYHDDGLLEYGGVRIYNWNRGAFGQQNLQGLLNNSLNVGAATLTTQMMGADTFYRYVRLFGFGQTTGIGVEGEASGLCHLPRDWDWSPSFLATNAFGQGIAVTPLQMAVAVSALANEGKMMVPFVVAERMFSDGRHVTTQPRVLETPIRAETARAVAGFMTNYVQNKLTAAQVPGYQVAGKTGTAQIPAEGGYDPNDVITSFIGFGPMPDPQILILVKLDRPGVDPSVRWGTSTAAPVFKNVAERIFVLLGIAPTELRAGP
ncbi:MAG: penicillin-binding protein 2 [Anaerolineae bacterium]|nr:penicillin-binding protein 2 [Anaerolineae bacterium]